MGPARTVNRPIVENHFSRSSLDARACAPEAEFYAKLSKLPKLYMVTPRDRQDNGAVERGAVQQKIGGRRVRHAVACGNYSVEIRGDKVRLGVEAPKEVPVHRNEVYEAIRRNQQKPDASDSIVHNDGSKLAD